ncbi:hypothetical protein DFJ73DRAFT_549252 [Zopfochytrium polystomum]|nr:hypothetical protein DFJ73DRAFT_549252 [Zopfochytrium polystomum]
MQPLTLPPPPDQDAAALRFASHRSSSAHQPHPHDQYHHQHLRQQQEQQQQQHQQPQYASLQYDHAHNHNTTVVNPLSYRHQQTLPPSIPVGMPAGGILVLPQTQYLPTMMISAESSYRVAATSAGTGTGASTTRRRQAQVANSSGRSSIPNHAQLAPSSMPLGQSNISTSSSCSTRSAFNSVQAPPAFPFSVGNGHRNELSNALAYYNTVFNTFPTSPFPSSFFPATSPNANSAGTSAEGFLGTLGNPGSVPSPISSSSVPSTASSASTVSSSDLPLMTPDVVSPGFPLTTRSDLISPGARPYWTHLESENPSEQQQRKRVLQKAQTRKLPSPQQPQHHHRPPQEQSNPLSSSVLISPGHRNSRGELYGESPDYGAAAIGSPMVVEPTFVEDSASPGIETASCPLVENTESFRRPSNVPQLLHPIVTSAQPSARGLPHAYIEKFPMLAPTDQVYLSDLPAQIHAQRRRTQSAVPLGLYRDSGNSPMCLPTSMSADGVDWISNPQRQQMGSIPTARGLMPSISQQPGAIGETPPGSVQSSSSSPRSPSTCSIDLVASSSQAPHRSPLVDDGDRPATSHSPVLSPARRSGQGSVVIMREGRPPFTNPKSAASSPLTPADYHPPALKMLNVDRQWRLADTSDPPESGANRDRLETVPLRHQTALVEDSGLNPPRRKSSSSSAGATGSTGSILPISGFGRKQRVRCKTAPGVTPALSDSDLALSGPPSPCDGRSNHAVRLAMANVTAAAAGGGGAVPPASPLRTHADRRKSAASPFQNQPHAPTFSTTDFLSLKVEEQQMMALESTLGGGWFVPSSPAVAIMPTFGDCQQVFSSGGWFPMPPDALVSSSTTLVDPHLTSVSSATAAFVFPPSLHEMQQMVPEYDFAAEAVLSTHPSAIMPPSKVARGGVGIRGRIRKQ